MNAVPFALRESLLAEELSTELGKQLERFQGQPMLLDIGCADLRAYSQRAQELCNAHNGQYYGLDLAAGALARAHASNPDIPLLNASVEALPFRDASFDFILLNDMIAYCNKARTFAEVYRILRPGGIVLSLFNNGIGWSLYKLMHPEKPMLIEWTHSALVLTNTWLQRLSGKRLFHTTYNSQAELRQLAENARFEIRREWVTEIGFAKLNLMLKKPLHNSPMPLALITGGYVSQNMGSAAMSIVTAKRLRENGFQIALLAKYPDDDAPLARRYDIPLVPAGQLRYTFLIIPLLIIMRMLAWPFPSLRIWVRKRWFKKVSLFYDVGGITFSRDRGISGLVINTTWLLLPLLLDVPVVKGSQAVGPFAPGISAWLSRTLLKRVHTIHARGITSHKLLVDEGISAQQTPDIAFLLAPEPWLDDSQQESIPASEFTVLLPSSVVMQRYDRHHGEGYYVKLMCQIIEHLARIDRPVVLLAHSFRSGETLNSNDLPVCRAIVARCHNKYLLFPDVLGHSPGELKSLIGKADFCVTGRFHGMIAALSSGVPVLVMSWSHKYREVLEDFDLKHCAIPAEELSGDTITPLLNDFEANLNTMRKKIEQHLPAITLLAEANFNFLPKTRRTTGV